MNVRHVLVAGTATAFAVLGLAACSSPAEPIAAPTTSAASSPATTGSSATGSKPATPNPSTSTPSGSGNKGSGSGGQGGGGTNVPSWSGVDFATETARGVTCPTPEKRLQVFAVKYADITGDGRTEALVTAACPSITSQNPIEVYVYDGRDRKAPLTRLGKIGAGLDLTKIKIVDTMGPEIRVEGEGLSAKAALCCPDLYITETWRWNGHQLVRLTGLKMPLSKANAG